MKDEDVKYLIDKYDRNVIVENSLIKEFYDMLDGEFTYSEIINRFKENDFKGIYYIDDEEYEERLHKTSRGMYLPEYQIIFIKKSIYKNSKEVVFHELGHAFIGVRDCFYTDNKKLVNTIAIQDGAMALFEKSKHISNIDNVDKVSCYVEEALLFRQLNYLYNYSDKKKYDNLLIHYFKEPENIYKIINDIYSSIINSKNDVITLRSTLYMLYLSNDAGDEKENSRLLFEDLAFLNSLYFALAEPEAYNKNNVPTEFKIFKDVIPGITDEEKFMGLYFKDFSYYEKIKEEIRKTLGDIISVEEDITSSNKADPRKYLLT